MKPLFTVPFPSDPDFIRRDVLCDEIQEKASLPGSRIVLFGLGGVGLVRRCPWAIHSTLTSNRKTQLAIEYAHQIRRESPEMWVFWVHASNAARCQKSLRDLASRAKIPGHEKLNTNMFSLVANWLQDECIGKWVLILDNVDDEELLNSSTAPTVDEVNSPSNASAQPPLRVLLSCTNGSVIVTSRSMAVALSITGNHKSLVKVQPMDKVEARNLLEKKLSTTINADDKDIARLAEALEFMPLAIAQAAAYITNRWPRCSVAEYLEEFQSSNQAMIGLLDYQARPINRDWEAKNSILVSWQITFDYVLQVKRSAANLLSLMAFFDPQGISENLLYIPQASPDCPGWRSRFYEMCRRVFAVSWCGHRSLRSKRVTTGPQLLVDARENDIETLRNYSFITIDEDPKIFRMHRLVQLATLRWLRTQNPILVEAWKHIFILKIHVELPTDYDEDMETWQSIIPHVKSALAQPPETKQPLLRWAALLDNAANYAI
jgi:hypothetical protein